MSLMRRGALFAGALFAGVLFGPNEAIALEPAVGGQTRAWRKPIHKPVRRREEDEALMLAVLDGL